MKPRGTTWLLRWLSALSLAGSGGAVAAGGCVGEYDCSTGPSGCEVINEDGTSNGYCHGKCVPPTPLGFSDPLILWIGSEALTPSCKDITWVDPKTGKAESVFYYEGTVVARSDRDGSRRCPTCACTAPACALPSVAAASSNSGCEQVPTATYTPFNPPPDWDGSCASPGTVAAHRNYGISIGPVTEVPCAPVTVEPPAQEEPVQVVFACTIGTDPLTCPIPNFSCMEHLESANLPEGFRHCVIALRRGDQEVCPAPAEPDAAGPAFSDKLTFHGSPRAGSECSPCACVPDRPSRCYAEVSVYEDRACSASERIGTQSVFLDQGKACLAAANAPGLGSLSAEWDLNEPGSCTPVGGGGPDVLTICCLPEPEE